MYLEYNGPEQPTKTSPSTTWLKLTRNLGNSGFHVGFSISEFANLYT